MKVQVIFINACTTIINNTITNRPAYDVLCPVTIVLIIAISAVYTKNMIYTKETARKKRKRKKKQLQKMNYHYHTNEVSFVISKEASCPKPSLLRNILRTQRTVTVKCQCNGVTSSNCCGFHTCSNPAGKPSNFLARERLDI